MNLLDCYTCKQNSLKDWWVKGKNPFKLCPSCSAEIDQLRDKEQEIDRDGDAKIMKHDDHYTVTIANYHELEGKFSDIKQAKEAIRTWKKSAFKMSQFVE